MNAGRPQKYHYDIQKIEQLESDSKSEPGKPINKIASILGYKKDALRKHLKKYHRIIRYIPKSDF